MTEALVVTIMLEAMRVTTLLAAPMLVAALVVGLAISIFQAVTQIQEQTLAIIPKMGAIMGVMAALFPWAVATQQSGVLKSGMMLKRFRSAPSGAPLLVSSPSHSS